MQKYKIISPFACLITDGKEEVFLEEGEALEIANLKILSIYPTSDRGISFNLNLEKEEDDEFSFVLNSEKEKLFVLKNGKTCQNFSLASILVGDKPCNLEIGERSVSFAFENTKKVLSLDKKFSHFSLGSLSSFCYALFSCKESEQLVLFDTNSSSLSLLSGEQIKINGNLIVVSQTIENFARHIIEKEYLVTQDGLIEKNTSINYQNGRPVVASIPEVVPYAFLEAVQVEDFELAQTYLDLNLKRKIDKPHLKEYFGKIQSFCPLSINNFVVNSNVGKTTYSFAMTENKISDIQEN